MDCERCGRELKSGKEVDQYHRIGSEQLKVTAYRWMGGIICFLPCGGCKDFWAVRHERGGNPP